MKSPIIGDHHHHHFSATWHNAMDGKVMIAQTLVRRTWWDFNPSAVADGVKTFLNTVFQQWQWNMEQQRCNLMNCDQLLSFECCVLQS